VISFPQARDGKRQPPMRNSSSGTQNVRFGSFELDLRAGELRRDGIKVKLQDQPFQILAMLLEQP